MENTKQLTTMMNADDTNTLYFSRILSMLRYGVLTVLAIIFFVPIFGTILTSLRTIKDISQNGAWTIPDAIIFDNLITAAGRLVPNLQASALITIPAVLGTCLVAAMASYALSRLRFRGRVVVFLGLVAGGFIPVHIQLIPVFKLMNAIGLYDTYTGLILTHIMRQIPISVLILTNFFNTVPGELREAARIDGASEFGTFFRIFLPLTRPALAALFIFLFTWIWNDLLWGLVLTQSPELKPVTVGILSFQGEFAIEWPMLAAGAIIATLPTVVVFLAFQRHFIKGLTMGSVKG